MQQCVANISHQLSDLWQHNFFCWLLAKNELRFCIITAAEKQNEINLFVSDHDFALSRQNVWRRVIVMNVSAVIVR